MSKLTTKKFHGVILQASCTTFYIEGVVIFSYLTYSALNDWALKQPLQIFNGINLLKTDRYLRLLWFLLLQSVLLFIFLLSLNWSKIKCNYIPRKKSFFLFPCWTSTMMSDSWKPNSFQDYSPIRNQLKMGTSLIHSTKVKQLFMSSQD